MLTISANQFHLDGAPFRVLSGALHYFRVVPEYWPDRLRKLHALGLNTVETYVAWNLHEPHPGDFRFDGRLDIVRFVELAAAEGLKVIIRPGPYICTEWELGGLPAWLLKDPAMRLRVLYQPYLDAVDRYLDAILPRLTPLQATRGGPIIAMQVENEYGSYGSDTAYLTYLADGLRARDVDVLLFTSDGPTDAMLQGGTVPGILKTVNFGANAPTALAKLREYHPNGPLMVTEFWLGWFDHWGEAHHDQPTDASKGDAAARTLDDILSAGASVNLYMAHGGTNFGFMNGANIDGGVYRATVTSYDYAAPLDEAGDPTPRYFALREVIGRHAPLPDLPLPPPSAKRAYGPVALTESLSLFDALDSLSERLTRPFPESMEAFDQDYGFILYRSQVSGPRPPAPMVVRHVRDRVQVFADGVAVGALEREFPERGVELAVPAEGLTLDLLVENMGRVNYGPDLLDRKGIRDGVLLGGQYLADWDIYPLPLDDLSQLRFGPLAATGPRFFRGVFDVDTAADTYLALPGWTKGVVWLNGFNLGRYWQRGPQQTLYIPAPLLKQGRNELVILELHTTARPLVALRDGPDLG